MIKNRHYLFFCCNAIKPENESLIPGAQSIQGLLNSWVSLQVPVTEDSFFLDQGKTNRSRFSPHLPTNTKSGFPCLLCILPAIILAGVTELILKADICLITFLMLLPTFRLPSWLASNFLSPLTPLVASHKRWSHLSIYKYPK